MALKRIGDKKGFCMIVCSEAPLIVVVLMIKNESASIEATLDSYRQGGLQHFLVFDTGSTDNTLELTQRYFNQHPLTVNIQQEPFVDFASSRNRALELAERAFPNAIFFIMPDAEWHLHNPVGLIQFCEQEKIATIPLYLMTIKMNSVEFTTARLFRVKQKIRFKGVVHEAPDALTSVKVPDTTYFEVQSTQQGIQKSQRRWEQDLVLLLNAFHDNDQDPRTTFYLAQTYECLGRLEEAYRFYQHRATIQGWDEENFITQFRLGCLAEQLSANPYHTANWDVAMNHYLQAFSLRPQRIEPLIKIAAHYWPDNIPSCYLFAKHAYDMPYPSHDLLFIEKSMYEYDRYEIMSRCAWYVQEYELGECATLKALEITPDAEHLKNNLALYQSELAKKA